jgi:RNA ligase (TIGR02306 family)
MQRKLATIQKISNIRPIEGRDRVVQANVLGYTVIVGKDNFQENESVVYCEVDSLFPSTETWKELERVKYRIKLFKVNSADGPIYGSGYCIPIQILNQIAGEQNWEVGQEVTELLGITKYEPPVEMAVGDNSGNFPTDFISQTDEIRIQTYPKVLDELRGNPYVIRQKCDGQSGTALILPTTQELTVCSRSWAKKNPAESKKPCSFWNIVQDFSIDKICKEYSDFALQFECCGPKIQKNRLGLSKCEPRVFNILQISQRRYLNHDEFEEMMDKFRSISPNLQAAKIIEIGDNFQHDLDSLQNLSIHKYDNGKWAEGIVIRPQVERFSKWLEGRLSFKMINPEFLAGGGD